MVVQMNVSKCFMNYVFDWDYGIYLNIGGYGSGKSHATAQKIILKLLEEKRTALVVRDVATTLKDSCFALIKSILQSCDLLTEEVGKNRDMTKVVAVQSPMEFRFPNGSRIIFRGMDNKEKIKSIHGVSIVWIEECSEISVEAYKELLGRVREPNMSLHIILTCNPIGKENWVYNMFFVRLEDDGKETILQDDSEFYRRKTIINMNVNRKNGGVYYKHSTVDDNPYVPKTYVATLDELKDTDPSLWLVARWGRFGANGTRVLPNFVVAKDARRFKNAVNNIPSLYHFFGLDFGFEESYNALISCAVDDTNKILYIYDEVYMNNITDDKFSKRDDVQAVKERAEMCDKAICADSAEPKTIQYYRQQGFPIFACKKYAGSRLQNTKKMKRFRKIVCSPKCKNTIRELRSLTYAKDSKGNVIYDEFNIDPHTFSALWYGLDKYTVSDLKDYGTNSKAG